MKVLVENRGKKKGGVKVTAKRRKLVVVKEKIKGRWKETKKKKKETHILERENKS